jgi:alpha-tubulin suppressor-like RCC1 family protein
MKTILDSRRHHYMKRVGTLLIAVALVAVMVVGCTPTPTQYNLTVTSTTGGSVTDPGEDTFAYDAGTEVNLVATPEAGYRFGEWTGDIDDIDDVEDATTFITMNGNYSVTAEFEEIPQYSLTISSTAGGNVTAPGEGVFTCYEGAVVDLVATPDAGCRFVEWTGDIADIGDGEDATTTITMNQDYSVTANFLAVYNLTIASTGPGSVTTPGEGPHDYDEGMVVNLVATPNTGCKFVNWTGDVGTIGNTTATTTTLTMNGDYFITANFQYIPMVAAGTLYTVGLSFDGTLVAVGRNDLGQCNIGSWTDIAQVAAGYLHTVGVKPNGTVVSVGWNLYGQRDVEGWTDIIQVAAGTYHTVGLESDGTVVAVGGNDDGQCNIVDWTDITQIDTSFYHTVGVKSEGAVLAVGRNDSEQCNVDGWTNIVQVAAGYKHTVGLKSWNAVVGVGSNEYGQLNIASWTDILQVDAGSHHTVGLKADGTVFAVGLNSYGQCNVGSWTDIIQVAAGDYHTVGLKSDGTVLVVGRNDYGQCNACGWRLFGKYTSMVTAGWTHTVGLKADGTVIAAGFNEYGQCTMSATGRTSSRSLLAVVARWDLNPTVPWLL